MKVIILIFFSLFALLNTKAQVSIGDQSVPHSRAILDLSNSNNLGLLLPRTASNPNSAYSTDTSGLLFYYNENLFLKGAGTTFNAITPWKSIFTGTEPIDVFFNPAVFEGVGIGVDGWLPGNPPTSNIKANLHIGLKSKDVNTTNTSASLLIGDSDSGVHMSMDNDEILVKNSTTNNTGTLKLQEGGGTVQVGESATIRSTLNVFGEVQQHGFALVPAGGIIMWSELGGVGVPPGWALCDGGLKTKLDGTNFTAPDLRERFIVGAGGENTTNPVVGAAYTNGNTGGANTVTLTTAQIPSHTHTLNIVSGGNHQHKALIDHGGGGSYGTDPGPGNAMWTDEDNDSGMSSNNPIANGVLPTDYQGSHNHSGSSNSSTGGNASHENRPPYYALAYIIKL